VVSAIRTRLFDHPAMRVKLPPQIPNVAPKCLLEKQFHPSRSPSCDEQMARIERSVT
jgi:hypothetical protein